MPRVLLALLGLLLLLPSAAAAQAPSTTRTSPLAQHDGTVLLSRWDGTAYHLATLRSGAIADVAGVDPQRLPFDADLGPDAAGETTIAVTIGGDVFTTSVDGGDLQPVAGVNTRGQDEHHPSLWRGRLAFARGRRTTQTTYVKTLGSAKPSVRLPGLPRQRCISVDKPTCKPVERGVVEDLELVGGDVAQSWSYQVDGAGGFVQNELRLVKATGKGGARQLRFMTSGEGGQSFVGLSVARGEVAWYVSCLGDPGGCDQTGGAYRFRIADGRYQRARDSTALGGWAWDGRLAWRSFADETSGCQGDLPGQAAACPITTDQPAWRAMKAPRLVR